MSARYLLAGILIAGILAGAVLFLKKNQPPMEAPALLIANPKGEGPEDAPIQIHEYSDFQCPACMKAVPVLNELMTHYPSQIYVVFHHFPLESHNLSLLAHQAAECAAGQNQFWPYHDELYEGQPQWSVLADPTEEFLRYAQNLGLDLDNFAKCLTDGRVRQRILDEKKDGERLRISSTPTFFINGERVLGAIELKIKGEAIIKDKLSNLWQSKAAADEE